MFIVFFKFSKNKKKAPELMSGHNEWIQKGFDDGIFLLVGSIKPNLGGAIFAHGVSQKDLEKRIKKDPFIAEKVVSAEIMEIDPVQANQQFSFLVEE